MNYDELNNESMRLIRLQDEMPLHFSIVFQDHVTHIENLQKQLTINLANDHVRDIQLDISHARIKALEAMLDKTRGLNNG